MLDYLLDAECPPYLNILRSLLLLLNFNVMKQLIIISMLLLYVGCSAIQTQWDYGITLETINKKNNTKYYPFIIIHKSSDSIVYIRQSQYYNDIIKYFDEYDAYTFVNGELTYIRKSWNGTIPTEEEQLNIALVGEHYSLLIENGGAYTRKIEDGEGGELAMTSITYGQWLLQDVPDDWPPGEYYWQPTLWQRVTTCRKSGNPCTATVMSEGFQPRFRSISLMQ